MGPSPARPGNQIGSAGQTTATSMDRYALQLLDLGQKAILEIEVENFPAIVVIDCNGNDLYEESIKENEELLNSHQNVLVVEKGSKGGFIGKTDSYIPVIVDDVNLGDFVRVKITHATATYLKGIAE